MERSAVAMFGDVVKREQDEMDISEQLYGFGGDLVMKMWTLRLMLMRVLNNWLTSGYDVVVVSLPRRGRCPAQTSLKQSNHDLAIRTLE
jgi:hypothetical protein